MRTAQLAIVGMRTTVTAVLCLVRGVWRLGLAPGLHDAPSHVAAIACCCWSRRACDLLTAAGLSRSRARMTTAGRDGTRWQWSGGRNASERRGGTEECRCGAESLVRESHVCGCASGHGLVSGGLRRRRRRRGTLSGPAAVDLVDRPLQRSLHLALFEVVEVVVRRRDILLSSISLWSHVASGGGS